MYLVYWNDLNAGPDCQARTDIYKGSLTARVLKLCGRLFDLLTKDVLYLPGSSVCDDPGKYKKKSYNKLCYKQINACFIFISIKKFHKT